MMNYRAILKVGLIGMLFSITGCYESTSPTSTMTIQGHEIAYHTYMRGIGHSSTSYAVLTVDPKGRDIEFDKIQGRPPYFLAAPDDHWIIMARSPSMDESELIVLNLDDGEYFKFPYKGMVADFMASPEVQVFREQNVLVARFANDECVVEARIDTENKKYLGEVYRRTQSLDSKSNR